MKKSILTILGILLGAIMGGNCLLAQQWTTSLDGILMQEGCITDDNTVIMVGKTADNDAFEKGALVKLFDNGQYELTVFPGYENKHVRFESVFPLSDGGYFVVGQRYAMKFPSNWGELLILIFDENMNLLREQAIEAEDFDGFDESNSVMDDDGTIVVMATARRPGSTGNIERKGVLFRFSQEGETLQCRYLVSNPPDPLSYMSSIYDLQMLNDPYSNRIVALCHGRYGSEAVLLFDHDFNLLQDHEIEDLSIPDTVIHYLHCRLVTHPRSDYWYNENKLLISAHQRDTTHGVNNKPHVLVGRMNLNGEITEKVDIIKPDTLFFAYGGMAYVDDTTVYVATRCNTHSVDKPFYPHVYLLSTDLELLGRVELWDDLNHEASKVFATVDGGSVIAEFNSEDGVHFNSRFRRFSRMDFHPISAKIKEIPDTELKAIAFPNPTKETLNIDISSLPENVDHRIRITDARGFPCMDRVIKGEGNVLTLGVSLLKSGIYTYSIYRNEKTIITGKFIKE